MKSKYIKKFVFDKAQYFVGDGNGNDAVLQIDYYSNTFEIKSKQNIDQDFQFELEKKANDLLKRKHGKNFAK